MGIVAVTNDSGNAAFNWTIGYYSFPICSVVWADNDTFQLCFNKTANSAVRFVIARGYYLCTLFHALVRLDFENIDKERTSL